jgi:uncharacterized membrane protein YedE/YeeE
MKYLVHFLIGIFFGFVLLRAEVISWFRIQEMFRFDSFHMFGIIGSAVAVGAISVMIIKLFNIKTLAGKEVNLTPKPVMLKANLFGGIAFGLGWALTGACPAPIYALIGSGAYVFILVLVSAYAGTYVYAMIRRILPH